LKARVSRGADRIQPRILAPDAALVDLLISRGHPVDLIDPRYKATPLGYAIHDCLVEKRHPEGDFPRVVESLLRAGSPWDPAVFPTGDERLDKVLSQFR
jgi:hypothetical protein